MTEAQVELATEDVVVQRVRDLYLDVVLLSEQGVHLPDVQVARQILAARRPSSDVVAGAASERRDVCNDDSSLLGVLDNVLRPPPRFSGRGQLCSTKYLAMRTGLSRLIPANKISITLLKILN